MSALETDGPRPWRSVLLVMSLCLNVALLAILGVGMVRDFTLPRFGTVQHRLDEVSEANHAIRYSLTKGRPLGMRDTGPASR